MNEIKVKIDACGVPGPAGPAGPQGPQGERGEKGTLGGIADAPVDMNDYGITTAGRIHGVQHTIRTGQTTSSGASFAPLRELDIVDSKNVFEPFPDSNFSLYASPDTSAGVEAMEDITSVYKDRMLSVMRGRAGQILTLPITYNKVVFEVRAMDHISAIAMFTRTLSSDDAFCTWSIDARRNSTGDWVNMNTYELTSNGIRRCTHVHTAPIQLRAGGNDSPTWYSAVRFTYTRTSEATRGVEFDYINSYGGIPVSADYFDKYDGYGVFKPRGLDMGNNTIKNIGTPAARSEGANKGYVDDALSSSGFINGTAQNNISLQSNDLLNGGNVYANGLVYRRNAALASSFSLDNLQPIHAGATENIFELFPDDGFKLYVSESVDTDPDDMDDITAANKDNLLGVMRGHFAKSVLTIPPARNKILIEVTVPAGGFVPRYTEAFVNDNLGGALTVEVYEPFSSSWKELYTFSPDRLNETMFTYIHDTMYLQGDAATVSRYSKVRYIWKRSTQSKNSFYIYYLKEKGIYPSGDKPYNLRYDGYGTIYAKGLDLQGGRISSVANPVNNADAASKSYVDNAGLVNGVANKTLDMQYNSLINLSTPFDYSDAAPKGYVDSQLDERFAGARITTVSLQIPFTCFLDTETGAGHCYLDFPGWEYPAVEEAEVMSADFGYEVLNILPTVNMTADIKYLITSYKREMSFEIEVYAYKYKMEDSMLSDTLTIKLLKIPVLRSMSNFP